MPYKSPLENLFRFRVLLVFHQILSAPGVTDIAADKIDLVVGYKVDRLNR